MEKVNSVEHHLSNGKIKCKTIYAIFTATAAVVTFSKISPDLTKYTYFVANFKNTLRVTKKVVID